MAMMSRRSGVGLAVVNGQLYAVGGFDGTTYLKTIEVFDQVGFTPWLRLSFFSSTSLDRFELSSLLYMASVSPCLGFVKCIIGDVLYA